MERDSVEIVRCRRTPFDCWVLLLLVVVAAVVWGAVMSTLSWGVAIPLHKTMTIYTATKEHDTKMPAWSNQYE